jgi:hypothetical protein
MIRHLGCEMQIEAVVSGCSDLVRIEDRGAPFCVLFPSNACRKTCRSSMSVGRVGADQGDQAGQPAIFGTIENISA